MPTGVAQTAFSGGEVSDEIYSRIDIEKYVQSAKTMRNFIAVAAGGAANRPGLRYVATTKDSTKASRLIPFSFNTEQTYILEFGDQYMRVFKDGAAVLEPVKTITGITQANPAVVTSTAHGYSNGDVVYIASVVGMTEVNGYYFTVAGVTANTFQLSGIDSTAYTAYTSGGQVARLFELTTPYVEADLPLLKFVQSADIMTICHASYAPRNLSRTAHYAWSLSTITVGPGVSKPTGLSSSYTGTGTGTDYAYVVTAVDKETGEESISSTSTSQTNKDLTTSGDKLTLTWTAVAGFRYNIYKDQNSSGFYGFIGSAENGQFIDRNIQPEYAIAPALATRNPFSGAGDWPGVVAYYQQRRMFANSDNDPQKIWGSQSANYENFNVSSPTQDSDAVTFSIVSQQVNEIRHLVPLKRGLFFFTSGGEWLAAGTGDNAVITPSSFRADQETNYGCSNVRPVVAGPNIIYVQEKGSTVRDLEYSLEIDGYSGNELSVLANHLFDKYEIKEMDFAKVPFSIVWAVRDDGTLLGMTYQREHQVWGWHRHDTAGKFESVAVVGEGQEDVAYFIVRRRINGSWVRTIERMDTRIVKDVRDGFFVDCGLSIDIPVAVEGATQANPVVVTSTGHSLSNGDLVDIVGVEGMTELNGNRYKVANVAANTFELQDEDGVDIDGTAFSIYLEGGYYRKAESTFTGLDHLEGETVSILADGSVLPQQVVSGGAITLTVPASRVHAGLPYTSDLEPLPPNMVTKAGTTQNRLRRISKLHFWVRLSRGAWVGPDAANLTEIKQDNALLDSPVELRTEIVEQVVNPSWGKDATVLIRQVDPLPLWITGVIPEITSGS